MVIRFTAILNFRAPLQDLICFIYLINSEFIDIDLLNLLSEKSYDHLWYISQESAALSFFNENLFVLTKIKNDCRYINIDLEK